jgi:glycosyltransferase involved in cell wall biosynthesis
MRIVMLGWEFPPFISGGLGTACHGLTRALDRRGHHVLFILPRPVDRSQASHVTLLSPDGLPVAARAEAVAKGAGAGEAFEHLTVAGVQAVDPAGPGASLAAVRVGGAGGGEFQRTKILGVPAGFSSPYGSGGAVGAQGGGHRDSKGRAIALAPDGTPIEAMSDEEMAAYFDDHPAVGAAPDLHSPGIGKTGAGAMYRGDLFAEAERYARLVVTLTRGEKFDVIHAHDWLTYPAGIALARVSGKPLIVHVHSTEFDRSGEHPNQRVYDVERRGMNAAIRVVAVSELTKNLCTGKYGVPGEKVDVVYNGIDDARLQPGPKDHIDRKDKIVLFLGRITMQKGPEYFIAAAKRVLEKVPEAKFIMAGAGDMEVRMIELAAQLGIGHRVLFTGFLRGADVDRVYRMADCYVMPSVSEPFGIAPLEAIRAGAPVIISKQSGVSEVLTHALKVDFWDIDEMANKIAAVLKYPPLSQTMREHGSFELRKLTWDQAAEACAKSYERAISEMGVLMGV